MDDRISTLEREVALLSERLAALERAAVPKAIAAPPEPVSVPAVAVVEARGPGIATLVGRSFVVLGGAFLLRSLTQVSQGSGETAMDDLGVVLGMVYAAVWLYLAHRAAKAGRHLDASVHSVVTTVIAFPLIWESTTRFHVLGPGAAAAATLVFGAAMLAGAARRGLPMMAWVGGTSAIATASALIVATSTPWALFGAALALSAATLGIAEVKGWAGLRWPVAGVLDLLGALALMLGGRRNYEWLTPGTVATMVLATGALFVASFAITTLVRRAGAGPFEVLQTLALIGLSYAGARFALSESTAAQVALPAILLAIGVLCLVATFAVLERREAQAVNVACFTLLGVALTIEGVRSLLPNAAAAAVMAACVLAAAWLGADPRRWAMRLCVAALALAAAAISGSLSATVGAFLGTEGASFPVAGYAVLGLAIASYVALRRSTATTDLTFAGVGFVLAVIAMAAASGALVLALSPLVQSTDLGALAVLRTGTLAAIVVVVAWAARGRAREELTWATYLCLGVAGLKILADDFRHGRAATMFLTLAIYGGVLILAPWLLRRHRAAAQA